MNKFQHILIGVLILILLSACSFLFLNHKKAKLEERTPQSTINLSSVDIEIDFPRRLFKALPLDTDFEREYFGKAVVLKGLDPYAAIVPPESDVDVTKFGFEKFQPVNIPDLISYYFPPEFEEKEASKKLIDHRLKKDIYQVQQSSGNETFSIVSKVPNLKVHALFNHNLEYRDDFLEYPLATTRSTREYCQSVDHCQTVQGNNMCSICDVGKEKRESKFFYREWCSLPNIDLSIISVADGILDYGSTHPDAKFNIYDKFGNIFMVSHHFLKYHKRGSWKIEHHPLLATIGTTFYPGAFGHFPIEILPRILFLHRFVPLHIPIVIYDFPFCRTIVNELYQYDIFPKERRIVWAKDNTYYVASRLYFIHSKSEIATPLTPDLILRMASAMLKRPFNRGLIPNALKENGPYILVVDRSDSGSRIIRNNDEMVKRVEAVVQKKGIKVISVKLSHLKSFFSIGSVFNKAIGIIAPHGAGLANLNVVNKSAKFVIEIGWKGFPSNFGWPGDYYCQARGLGIKYYAAVTVQGSYYSQQLDVDVNEIVEIVEKEIK